MVRESRLTTHTDRLEKALAVSAPGREQAWAQGVLEALEGLRGALPRHTEDAEAPKGLLVEVDLTRPSLVRQVGDLCREHREFPEEVAALGAELGRVVVAFGTAAGVNQTASPLPGPSPAPGTVPLSCGSLRQRGEQLVQALRRHEEEEAKLLLESVNTDLGAGD